MHQIIQTWLLQAFILFLLVGALVGVAVGALLLLRPQSVRQLSQKANRWISTRHLDQSLEQTVNLDPWFHRYRRTTSALTLLGSVYILYFFSASMNRADTISGLAGYYKTLPLPLLGALLDALVLSALLGSLFSAVISLFLLVRPSLLRDFERAANRWVSLRRALKPAEVQRTGLDEYVYRHGRGAGILLMLGSLYVLVLLTTWIGH